MDDGRASEYHPLYTAEDLVRLSLGSGVPVAHFITRRSGKTLANALTALAKALEQPGIRIDCIDHTGRHMMRSNVRQEVQQLVEKLGLKGFTFQNESLVYMARQ